MFGPLILKKQWRSLIDMNVDGIMTDDAVLLKNVCSKANLF